MERERYAKSVSCEHAVAQAPHTAGEAKGVHFSGSIQQVMCRFSLNSCCFNINQFHSHQTVIPLFTHLAQSSARICLCLPNSIVLPLPVLCRFPPISLYLYATPLATPGKLRSQPFPFQFPCLRAGLLDLLLALPPQFLHEARDVSIFHFYRVSICAKGHTSCQMLPDNPKHGRMQP